MDMAVVTIPVVIIMCFFKWSRYQNSSIENKIFIVNLLIESIHLMLFINSGLIIEAVDCLEKIMKHCKAQFSAQIFLLLINLNQFGKDQDKCY